MKKTSSTSLLFIIIYRVSSDISLHTEATLQSKQKKMKNLNSLHLKYFLTLMGTGRSNLISTMSATESSGPNVPRAASITLHLSNACDGSCPLAPPAPTTPLPPPKAPPPIMEMSSKLSEYEWSTSLGLLEIL